MRIPTVSRFLCCIDLSTGNKIVAWIILIFYFIFIALAFLALIVGFNVDVTEYREVEVTSYEVAEDVENKTIVQNEIREIRTRKFSTAESMIVIIITCVLALVCIWFIYGINMRDKRKMMPYIIQNGVFGILFLGAAIFFLSIYFLIKSLILLYITICAYSLYSVYAYEDEQKQETEMMNANMDEYSHNYEAEGNFERAQQFQGP
ncbi:hypothetical protein PVAND_017533 [Polypedilum vanderplanki]|uniref:Uncharacterized protein n=1 Tax=Polypedilum vanderplanki TaxID=319348 RepID=A0A9J6BIC8_POLVA|nr:hypothetical protein PVAND_017533 [Polypedilum vanderplanki]